MKHIHLACDVLVAGGGPAGVPAAIAAARAGAKTILIQDRSVLGGNASSEVRMHIMGADGGRRGREMTMEAREGGIIEELRLDCAVRNPQRAAVMLALVFYEACRAEPNLTLLLNTTVTGATREGAQILTATAERQSTEHRFTISAAQFIDCTGDGRLGAEAGAPFHRGREGIADHGETLAQPQGDNKSLGSTLLLTARKHDRPMPFIAPPWVRRFCEEDFRLRPFRGSGVDMGYEYGYWWAEWGGQLDTIGDNETIRDELLAITLGVWDYIKNHQPEPHRSGAAHWALDWFGFLPGKRESRRFIGQHVLTEHDLLETRPHADGIGHGGWAIDLHPPEGVDRPDLKPYTPTRVPYLYDIPLRTLVSCEIDNLLFAGRNHSATHVAFASTRVMATCAAMGQGAGTAAAYAVAHGVAATALAGDPRALRAIRQRLLRDDQFVLGERNTDPHDRARAAAISADSARAEGDALNVISGQTRAVDGEGGASPGRALPGSNRWLSVALPATLTLTWDAPVQPAEIHLVFDTGQHRLLTLSPSDGCMAKQVWGAQPETVRDYAIDGLVDGTWVELHRVAGNHQRRSLHRLTTPPLVRALRLRVDATNGVDHARVCEVRVYEPGAPVWVQ